MVDVGFSYGDNIVGIKTTDKICFQTTCPT